METRVELKEAFSISSRRSICKVPRKLRSVNEDAYTPHAVLIGPFYDYGGENLKYNDDFKRPFLLSLFQRTQKRTNEIEGECFRNIQGLVEDVQACYAEPIKVDKPIFARVLLLDAGIILDLFFRSYEKSWGEQGDAIFITSWMRVKLQRDLALLENQIPWFVLDSLFNVIKSHGGVAPELPTLEELALRFFKSLLNMSEETLLNEKRGKKVIHLLHLLHSSYLPADRRDSTIFFGKRRDSTSNRGGWEFIPCATSLRQAGVLFRKNTNNSLFNLEFENGTFKIPPLIVDDNTDSLFRNLVAFEQCQQHIEQYLTSYFTLMDMLIDTADDVELLQQSGILKSYLGRADDVASLFNNFRKHLVLTEFHYTELCQKVNAYANTPRHRYIAALRRDYFRNPWSIISFVAAVILLVLTFLQTLYTIYGYYHPRR